MAGRLLGTMYECDNVGYIDYLIGSNLVSFLLGQSYALATWHYLFLTLSRTKKSKCHSGSKILQACSRASTPPT